MSIKEENNIKSKLLPCPFCGNTEQHVEIGGTSYSGIYCKCGCLFKTGKTEESIEKAIEIYNSAIRKE